MTRRKAESKNKKRWTQTRQRRRIILEVANEALIEESRMLDPLLSSSSHLTAASTKPVETNGPKRKGAKATRKIEKLVSQGFELEPMEATAFRALSARGNYLAADRPDVAFSAKELCREFSRPNQNSFHKLKRLARYLLSHKRLVYKYDWSDAQHSSSDGVFDIFVDTDFAGCGQTRRSTSGGAVMNGDHCIKHWSVTQSTLSLSSGESELHGISKGIATALGLKSLAKDLGFNITLRIHSDACAAIGIARRRGLGKVRHLDVEDLWVQQKVRDGTVQLLKVAGVDNPADIFTKYVAADLLNKMLGKLNLIFMDGRPEAAPELPPERP